MFVVINQVNVVHWGRERETAATVTSPSQDWSLPNPGLKFDPIKADFFDTYILKYDSGEQRNVTKSFWADLTTDLKASF